jgi:hypothetical protein
MKAMVRRPANPIPDAEAVAVALLLSDVDIFLYFLVR